MDINPEAISKPIVPLLKTYLMLKTPDSAAGEMRDYEMSDDPGAGCGPSCCCCWPHCCSPGSESGLGSGSESLVPPTGSVHCSLWAGHRV